MMPDWTDITYLKNGTSRQRMAYPVLVDVVDVLTAYHPILTGTIPLDIDTPESDLDVICYADDLNHFFAFIQQTFSADNGFWINQYPIGGEQSVVANFHRDGFVIELFGQSRPVLEQSAYRHMVVEARLLQIGGLKAKDAIRELKASGIKTEPAFAQYFGLSGDPYQVLLDFYDLTDAELIERITI